MRGHAGFAGQQAAAQEELDREKPREPPAAGADGRGEAVQEGGGDDGEEDEAVVVEVARGDERGDGGEEELAGVDRGGS